VVTCYAKERLLIRLFRCVICTSIGMLTMSQLVVTARLSITLFLILNLAVESLVEQLA
jgi:hypothetical protein